MAEGREEQNFGCTAWLEVIRGTVNERLAKARNSLHRRRHSENKNSLIPLIQMTGAGSGDLVIARKQTFIPRPATIDMKEDIIALRAMISSLDTADKRYADVPLTEIDVDRVVDDMLQRVSEEFLVELQSSTCCVVGSPLFTPSCTSLGDSPSVTSSQISDYAETIVKQSLTRIVSQSEVQLGVDMTLDCKQIGNELNLGAVCCELVAVAE